MIAVFMSGMCVCGLLGRLWPRYNWQGAIASLLIGMATALIISWHTPWNDFWGNPVLPAVIAAALAGIVVSLLTVSARGDYQQTTTPQEAAEEANNMASELTR